MSPALHRLAAALTGAAPAVLAPVGAHADGTVHQELVAAKKALNKYKDEERATADGYLPDDVCVESPEGVMGYHYADRNLIDRELDAREPEALVYQPDGYGGRKLVAVEYFYVDEDQDVSTDDDRPPPLRTALRRALRAAGPGPAGQLHAARVVLAEEPRRDVQPVEPRGRLLRRVPGR
ncbi:hypothetical protein A6A08_23180 [Nocardiopsis sp. TSRI0078]|uniref:hypothetical protein n=1 Tax=unclassified Nocardiopsis TaxID=2649073 RepID=UPI000968B13B|nr:hypothetical protein [Nocardiopsis sp. TSRI0078]OKI20461.1 hypothetical protein A6A08_23180 [Nocardiopsis sp. TSRI0078]